MFAVRLFLSVCFLCLAALISNVSGAQTEYPARPIRFIVPFTPAGPTDGYARLVAEPLTKALGQQVVVDNRAGAAGRIGIEIVSKSAADGYTILIGSQGTLAMQPAFYHKLPYNLDKDFAPIVLLVRVHFFLLVNLDVPASNLKELLSLLNKSRPGQFSFASAGIGTVGHFVGEQLKRRAQADIVHVPYKGDAPALTALIGREVAIYFSQTIAARPHIKGGRVKAIAFSAPRRSPLFPEVPTFEESGLPDFEVSSWFGIMTRAGVPSGIVTRLNEEINRILRMEDVRARLETFGAEPAGGSVSQFAAHIRSERVKWAKVIKETGIVID